MPATGHTLDVTVTWGDYQAPATERAEGAEARGTWQRSQHVERLPVDVTRTAKPIDVPGSRGLQLVVSTRKSFCRGDV